MATRARKRPNEQTHVVTHGTTIRIEEPSSSRGKKPKVTIIAASAADDAVGGFVDFLREHAVVGLAIGFIIGVQAQGVVKQLVTSFIDPIFQLLFGEALSQRDFTAHFRGREREIEWGAFAHVLLNFVFVLAAIYAIVKIFKLDKLDKKKETK
jgi:large-conductance mechanosensitive channel